ncbi:uncharacterized protein LTR77_000189 [Saxophila tyrrhenica]|uniref:Zinc/iron permease n=1 Tax=Saxophila tyrrhenica TaxID=1690608 RepID=A0AAV9PMJ0_9PEZI|nr:hypothetical protein LTR77_000189 [Saxophila tyrrhenica]
MLPPSTPDHLKSLAPRATQPPKCSSPPTTTSYNTPLHILALFLILLCGTTACLLPTLTRPHPRLSISRHALFISRHFGTGVLIALAFCHLLPTAFENLWNECLPHVWREGYAAMPGCIAMVGALAVAGVEMGFELRGVRCACAVEGVGGGDDESGRQMKQTTQVCATGNERAADLICPCETSDDRGSQSDSVEAQSDTLTAQQADQRRILQCLLLEAGILFHSVFIGLSISLSTGTTFIALMVAIAIHQIFEGRGLGARIAGIERFSVRSVKPWGMAFAYGLTCPLGQAIGLGLRKTYDPEGTTALLVVGVANAISAGMILYAGLVQLLGEDLLSEKSYATLSTRSRLEAVAALVFGCGIMAAMATWA